MKHRTHVFNALVIMISAAVIIATYVFAPSNDSGQSESVVEPVQTTIVVPVTEAATTQNTVSPSLTRRSKHTLALSDGLNAVKNGQYITIDSYPKAIDINASPTDKFVVVQPTGQDLAQAATLCPKKTTASAPVTTEGSYRQFIGSTQGIGAGSGRRRHHRRSSGGDVTVTVMTTITCLSR